MEGQLDALHQLRVAEVDFDVTIIYKSFADISILPRDDGGNFERKRCCSARWALSERRAVGSECG